MLNPEETLRDRSDAEMIQLLDHRYGDGLVYMREASEQRVYEAAIRMGFVSHEGYLTPEGQVLLDQTPWD